MKILFICHANVGRSQMAEAFYNFHTGTSDASSAGIEDVRKKYQYRPATEIIETMREKGIDISQQRITLCTSEMVQRYDQIVVLCDKQLCPAFLRTGEHVIFKKVHDPYQADKSTIRVVRDQIESIVLRLCARQESE